MDIRQETQEDHSAISALTTLAFDGMPYAGGAEAEVVERLRAADALSLSLVAEEDGEVVGQVTFSPAQLADGSGPWFALGPVSVTPRRQGEGIGGALIRAGLEAIEHQGALGCILTGNPDYYTRFGFVVSPQHCPENEPGEYFHLKLLGASDAVGQFSFHPAFYGPVPAVGG